MPTRLMRIGAQFKLGIALMEALATASLWWSDSTVHVTMHVYQSILGGGVAGIQVQYLQVLYIHLARDGLALLLLTASQRNSSL